MVMKERNDVNRSQNVVKYSITGGALKVYRVSPCLCILTLTRYIHTALRNGLLSFKLNLGYAS